MILNYATSHCQWEQVGITFIRANFKLFGYVLI